MLRTLIVTAFGLGKMRPAPGTWGSTPPAAIAILMLLAGFDSLWIDLAMLALLILSSIACVALGEWAERRYQGKDPGVVVIDEVAGMSLSLLLVRFTPPPAVAVDPLLYGAVVVAGAFVLFRILDVIKAPPANAMQQFPAGWGILFDDLASAVYVNILLQIFLRVALPWLAGGSPSTSS